VAGRLRLLGGGFNNSIAGGKIKAEVWYHLVCTIASDGTLIVYVNGEAFVVGVGTWNNVSGDFNIGSTTSCHTGEVSSVTYFENIELTAAEVAERYALLTGSLDEVIEEYTAPVHHWKMDDITGDTELVADWDMKAAGTTDWNGTLVTLSKVDGDLRMVNSSAGSNGATNPVVSPVTVGEWVEISAKARSYASGQPHLAWDPYAPLWTGTTSTDWQYYHELVQVPAGKTNIRMYASVSPGLGKGTEWEYFPQLKSVF